MNTTDFATDFRFARLPARLVRCQQMAMHREFFLDLSMTGRRALKGILRFVKCSVPDAPIYPRREKLAQAAECGSEQTLRRGLAELESRGYIVREQKRQLSAKRKLCTGRFGVSFIRLTEKALTLLDLRSDEAVAKEAAPYPSPMKIKTARDGIAQPAAEALDAGHIHNSPSLKIAGRNIKEPTRYKNHNPSENSARQVEIDPATRLPKPLLPLLDLGLKRVEVCMLMKRAREAKKRLESVFLACKSQIARASNKLAYITALLAAERDFEWLAKAASEEAANDEADSECRRVEAVLSRSNGAQILGLDNEWLGTISAEGHGGGTALVQWSDRRTTPINRRFAKHFIEQTQAGNWKFSILNH